MVKVAIVGAGPAGSNCAYTLTQYGMQPVIFDHSHPREKPCGGLTSDFIKDYFPILEDFQIESNVRNSMRLISPNGRAANIYYKNEGLVSLSRLKFDNYLLNVAVNSGATLIKDKVIAVEHRHGYWKVYTQKHSYDFDVLVGADGVNSVVRNNIIGPLNKEDLGLCLGYFVRGYENTSVTVKFSTAIKGYLWMAPRVEGASLGGGTAEMSLIPQLKNELSSFINQNYPNITVISKWASLIPNLKNVKTFLKPVSGSDWVLIGDAAGHVDPISGSGIIYALLDGEMAGNLIAEGQPELFDQTWRKRYGRSLFLSLQLRGLIYRGPLLELYCRYMKLHSLLPFG